MYDDISGNAEQFAQALNQLGQQIEDDVINKVIRKFIFWMLERLTIDTPKETCRARTSWMADVDWSEWVLPPGDYTGVDISSRVAEIIAALPKSDHYTLYNNIEYIVPLENGHSTQAPQGFVAQILAAAAMQVGKLAQAAGYEATT